MEMVLVGRFSFFILAIVLSVFFCRPSLAHAGIFSESFDKVDLSRCLSIEEYIATGTGDNLQKMFERLDTARVSPSFKEMAEKIDSPITVLMVGMMFCPDCKAATPYLEAMARINPLVSTRYIARDTTEGAREFMLARTGQTHIPTIFITNPDGDVLDGAYIETPSAVTALLESSDSEEERRAILEEFRAGGNDEDIQSDLAALVETALAGGR
jgi:glutaredoxin